MNEYFRVTVKTDLGVMYGLRVVRGKSSFVHNHVFSTEANLKRFATQVRGNESSINFRKNCWLNAKKFDSGFNKSLLVLPAKVGNARISEVVL